MFTVQRVHDDGALGRASNGKTTNAEESRTREHPIQKKARIQCEQTAASIELVGVWQSFVIPFV